MCSDNVQNLSWLPRRSQGHIIYAATTTHCNIDLDYHTDIEHPVGATWRELIYLFLLARFGIALCSMIFNHSLQTAFSHSFF